MGGLVLWVGGGVSSPCRVLWSRSGGLVLWVVIRDCTGIFSSSTSSTIRVHRSTLRVASSKAASHRIWGRIRSSRRRGRRRITRASRRSRRGSRRRVGRRIGGSCSRIGRSTPTAIRVGLSRPATLILLSLRVTAHVAGRRAGRRRWGRNGPSLGRAARSRSSSRWSRRRGRRGTLVIRTGVCSDSTSRRGRRSNGSV